MSVIVNDVEYDSIYMSVYDRIGKGKADRWDNLSPTQTVMYYNGINTDGIRYVKSLYGYVDGRRVLIDRY